MLYRFGNRCRQIISRKPFWSLYGELDAAISVIKFMSQNFTNIEEMGILGFEFLKKDYNSDISSRLILMWSWKRVK